MLTNLLLITEREGCTGEYWPRSVVAVRTERSKVCIKATDRESQHSPVQLAKPTILDRTVETLVQITTNLGTTAHTVQPFVLLCIIYMKDINASFSSSLSTYPTSSPLPESNILGSWRAMMEKEILICGQISRKRHQASGSNLGNFCS